MRLDQQSGGYENAYKYTGKELDAETDLYYYGARYYDAKIGRFVSVDPWFGDLSDPQSFNKYSYVRNNPLKYVDPSGEKLVLTGTQEFKNQTYNDLQSLSPYLSQTILDNGNVEIGFTGGWYEYFFSDTKKGDTLLSRVISDNNTVTLNEDFNNDPYTDDLGNGEDVLDGKEVDVSVYTSTQYSFFAPVYDSKNKEVVNKTVPTFIILGHELIHAYDFISGKLNSDSFEEYSYLGLDKETYSAAKVEITTVGLDYNKSGDVTENDLREEHNLQKRNNY